MHINFISSDPAPFPPSFHFSRQTVALVAASLAARDAAVFVNDKLITPAQAAALALARTDTDRFREEDDFDGDVCLVEGLSVSGRWGCGPWWCCGENVVCRFFFLVCVCHLV